MFLLAEEVPRPLLLLPIHAHALVPLGNAAVEPAHGVEQRGAA
jgi:hypothetical protein